MQQSPGNRVAVFQASKQRPCLEAHMVLDAVGIPAEIVQREGFWLIVVDGSDAEAATAELEAYRAENSGPSPHARTRTPLYGGAGPGVVVYTATILLVAYLSAQRALGFEWFVAGRMRAGDVMSGEWWRIFTALTLHLDAAHLVGNMAFGTVFGLLAGRVLGGGVAWLAIVVAGAMGNGMNAIVQSPEHASIGASTAVFAALGTIVSHALRPRKAVQEKRLKRWSPLIAGIVLLGFTGVGGPRTDVVAHVTGFLAGLLIGWAGCRLPHRWLTSRTFQASTGLAALVMIIGAWVVGLLAAG